MDAVLQSHIPLEEQICQLLRDAVHSSLSRPDMAMRYARIYQLQNPASRRRRAWARAGIAVPALLLAEVSGRLSLHCQSCHTWTTHRGVLVELRGGALHDVLQRARELGIGFVVLAPRDEVHLDDLLDLTSHHTDICLPLLLKAPLDDRALIRRLRSQPHVLPMVSCRRQRLGCRSEQTWRLIEDLSRADLLFGVTVDLCRTGLGFLDQDALCEQLVDKGCGLVAYASPAPNGIGQFRPFAMMETVRSSRLHRLPALFIHSPETRPMHRQQPRFEGLALPTMQPQPGLLMG